MTAFYVGQRVRVVRNVSQMRSLDRVIGLESFVVSVDAPHGWAGHTILLAEYGSGLLFHPDDLEPILPPGLESLAEINALYEPSPEVVA